MAAQTSTPTSSAFARVRCALVRLRAHPSGTTASGPSSCACALCGTAHRCALAVGGGSATAPVDVSGQNLHHSAHTGQRTLSRWSMSFCMVRAVALISNVSCLPRVRWTARTAVERISTAGGAAQRSAAQQKVSDGRKGRERTG